MKRTRIAVMAYSGYRGEEYPRSLILEGKAIDVAAIERQWTEEDHEHRDRKRCFRVKGSDGHRYLLCCRDMTGDWYLE